MFVPINSDFFKRVRKHGRLGSFCEDFLSKLTCTAAFDAVKGLVHSCGGVKMRGTVGGTHWERTDSSAPSIVTSMARNWSTSPKARPEETMSSLDWKPSGMG